MARRGEPAGRAALRGALGRWNDVVELFARRRRGRHRVDPRAYAALHAELLAACRSLAATADEPDRRRHRALEDLVRPWLDPRVLARTDREILHDLLARCRQAERDLGGRRRGARAAARAVLVFLLPTAAAVLLVLLRAWMPEGGPSLAPLRDGALALRVALRGTSALQRLALAGLAILVASYVAVTRTARS